MTSHYAQNTEVSSDRSRAEIEKCLNRYGADGFGYAAERDRAMIAFRLNGRMIRYSLIMPDRNADEFRFTPSRKWARAPEEILKAYDQACRQRWRALALVVKAKLEAVETGITTMEEEFLAWIVLPDNTTIGGQAICALKESNATGRMPSLVPGLRDL